MSDVKYPKAVESLMSHDVTIVSGEVLTFIKNDGTVDAGEAAGTIVYGKLDKGPVLNLLADSVGEFSGSPLSTSLLFTTGVLDSTKEVGFIRHGNLNERLTRTAALLTVNGQWAIDYRTGVFVIKKLTSGTSQTITSYKVYTSSGSVGGGGGGGDIATAGADDKSNTANAQIVESRLQAFDPSGTWDRVRAGFTTPSTSMSGWLNALPWAIFNATPTTRTEGQGGPLQADNTGSLNMNPTKIPTSYRNLLQIDATVEAPTIDSGLSWDSKCSIALENTNLVKTIPCQFKGIDGYIDQSAASGPYFLQIWDRASAPAPGTPISASFLGSIPLQHTQTANTLINPDDFPSNGKFCGTGLFVGLSTAPFTYQPVAGSLCNFTSIRTK